MTRREKLAAIAATKTGAEMLELLSPIMNALEVPIDLDDAYGCRIMDLTQLLQNLDAELEG